MKDEEKNRDTGYEEENEKDMGFEGSCVTPPCDIQEKIYITL